MVVPSPSRPFVFLPQAQRVPSLLIPKEEFNPAQKYFHVSVLICWAVVVVGMLVPIPIGAPSPQDHRVPSLFCAKICAPPELILTQSVWLFTSVGVV